MPTSSILATHSGHNNKSSESAPVLSAKSASIDEQLSFQFQSAVSLANNTNNSSNSQSSSPLPTTTAISTPTTSSTTIEEILRNLKSATSSQNITESVPVPSSEHVAEIVGRQGCKIKALRAKTNTYIKTPVRGEAPMFVITGRIEDVQTAKHEIQLAADHFSQIRARRGSSSSSSSGGGSGGGSGTTNNSSSYQNNTNTASVNR